MRVALISPGLPADEADSSCIPALQHWLRSLPASVDLTGWSLHYPRRRHAYSWFGHTFHSDGGASNQLGRAAGAARTLRTLTRLHRERRFDVVHALWLSDAALIGSLTARRLRVPLVLSAMGQDVLPGNRYLPILRRLAPRATQWVATCARSARLLSGRHPVVDVHTVPWGFADSWQQRPQDSSDKPPIDVLGVGALTDNKDYDTFVDALEALQRDHSCPLQRVVLLGDGPNRSRLQERIAAEGLDHIVTLPGHVSNEQVLDAFSRSRVLLHPARFEGFGFVLQEALAHEVAIVSRTTGCAPERSTVNWRLFERPEQAAAEIADLLADRRNDPLDRAPRTDARGFTSVVPVSETVSGYQAIYDRVGGPEGVC